MSVTPAQVGVELGVASPTPLQIEQWQSWIDQALYLIGKRLVIADLDPADVDYVVLQAVKAHAEHPSKSTSVDVAIDDGRIGKRYESGAGKVVISDDLWGLLDPDLLNQSGVGSTQLYGEPDAGFTDSWF